MKDVFIELLTVNSNYCFILASVITSCKRYPTYSCLLLVLDVEEDKDTNILMQRLIT